MNRGVFITVATCLGFIALILALFLSRFYTPRELTLDEYKLLGAYFIDPPRQLAEFKLVDDSSNILLQNNLRVAGMFYSLDLRIVLNVHNVLNIRNVLDLWIILDICNILGFSNVLDIRNILNVLNILDVPNVLKCTYLLNVQNILDVRNVQDMRNVLYM